MMFPLFAFPLALAAAQDLQVAESKIQAPLMEAFEAAAPGELVHVAIAMRDQRPAGLIEEARSIPDKEFRREYVQSVLQAIAAETQADVLELLAEGQDEGRVARVKPLWVANVVAARVDLETAQRVAALDEVAYIHQDSRMGEEVLTSLPGTLNRPPASTAGGTPTCGVSLIRADQVWSTYGITGDGVVVGMIDTGTCVGHPDINANIWTNPGEVENGIDDDGNGYVDDLRGWNFEDDNNQIADLDSHGSHTAGTVAGDGTGGTQAGVAPGAEIMTLKFWNSFSGESTVWEAHQYSIVTGADVTSASLGWPQSQSPDRAMWRMVTENAMAAGVVVVYVSGNEGTCCPPFSSCRTPGDVPDMITVGAVDCSDTLASFSSQGPITWQDVAPYNDFPYPPGKIKPTVMADGSGTVSHNLCSGYKSLSGTSMAAPHVTGVVALLLEADPSLDHWGVMDLLTDTAVDLGDPGNDNVFGFGRVDAFDAVSEALGLGCSDSLCVSVQQISGATGGAQAMDLDAGPAWAGFEYRVLGSKSGTSPGFPFGPFTIPLNVPDSYFDYTLTHANNGVLQGTAGVLDANGRADASIVIPPGLSPVSVDHCFLVLDFGGAVGVTFVSNTTPLTIQ